MLIPGGYNAEKMLVSNEDNEKDRDTDRNRETKDRGREGVLTATGPRTQLFLKPHLLM